MTNQNAGLRQARQKYLLLTQDPGAALIRGSHSRPLILKGRGQVAQLVEQRIENPRVGGSIPPLATNLSLSGLGCNSGHQTAEMSACDYTAPSKNLTESLASSGKWLFFLSFRTTRVKDGSTIEPSFTLAVRGGKSQRGSAAMRSKVCIMRQIFDL